MMNTALVILLTLVLSFGCGYGVLATVGFTPVATKGETALYRLTQISLAALFVTYLASFFFN